MVPAILREQIALGRQFVKESKFKIQRKKLTIDPHDRLSACKNNLTHQ